MMNEHEEYDEDFLRNAYQCLDELRTDFVGFVSSPKIEIGLQERLAFFSGAMVGAIGERFGLDIAQATALVHKWSGDRADANRWDN